MYSNRWKWITAVVSFFVLILALVFEYAPDDTLLRLYHLSGLVIAVASILALLQIVIGFQQLLVAKDSIKTRLQREAATATSELCEKFANNILGLHVRASNELGGFSTYQGQMDESFTVNSDTDKWYASWEKSGSPGSDAITHLLNNLEAFALYFTQGVSDEKCACVPIGIAYISIVRDYYPIIVKYRKLGIEYANIVQLADIWIKRMMIKNLEEQKKIAMDQVFQAQVAASKLNDNEIPPVGLGVGQLAGIKQNSRRNGQNGK